MIRWNITIPEKTDRAVRTFLARTGGKNCDLSRFVDEAVRKRVFDLTVNEIKDRNAQYDQQEILELINQETDAVHADCP
ncbi:MAG: ribbon-helix-helix domain-containing protein [Desulfohalobiaceae bacterium]|nr:ribbon-helix-helix domain-containing protein [Desulfohalobiaceae bacterium]